MGLLAQCHRLCLESTVLHQCCDARSTPLNFKLQGAAITMSCGVDGKTVPCHDAQYIPLQTILQKRDIYWQAALSTWCLD